MQLTRAFREQTDVRRCLLELEKRAREIEIEMETSCHLITIAGYATPFPPSPTWAQDARAGRCGCTLSQGLSLISLGWGSWKGKKSHRALKRQEEQRKESYTKDDSEKDSDTGSDPPEDLEPPEVASAWESITALVDEQKKLHKEVVSRAQRAWGMRSGHHTWGPEEEREWELRLQTLVTLPGFFTSLCLTFLSCKMGVVEMQPSWGLWRGKIHAWHMPRVHMVVRAFRIADLSILLRHTHTRGASEYCEP